MAEVGTCGMTAACTRVYGTKTKSMAEASMSGLMAGGTKESGKTTTCTEEECTPGRMVESMMGSTRMIGSMAMGYTHGLMGGSTRGSGATGSNMEMASIDRLEELRGKESGKMEREYNGLIPDSH